MHPQTAYRWFRDGTLPVPAQRVGPRMVLVNIEASTAPEAVDGLGLYARVSSHDQKEDLERQVARLTRSGNGTHSRSVFRNGRMQTSVVNSDGGG